MPNETIPHMKGIIGKLNAHSDAILFQAAVPGKIYWLRRMFLVVYVVSVGGREIPNFQIFEKNSPGSPVRAFNRVYGKR